MSTQFFTKKIAAYTQQSLDFKKIFLGRFQPKPRMQPFPSGHGHCYFVSTAIFFTKNYIP
jgi:hypothetical protein